jgi:NADPH:quinone reductase-like Zn-dependent oxidoreductase
VKAIVHDRYGAPEVLALREIDVPAVGDDGVLVRIHAASVNALDWHSTRGMPYVGFRLGRGLLRPRHAVRGVDLSGRVVEVGKNVTRFKTGDDVFGGADGSFAEYAVTSEKRLALKPAGVDHAAAATLHVAALTALQGLRDVGRAGAGQRVLVNGAGGGVGTFALQIAKWLGAHVTAVTRTESLELVRSLGADVVVDYRTDDFTRAAGAYDVIFDIGGNRRLSDCRSALASNGTYVVVGAPAGRWLAPATRFGVAVLYNPFVPQRFTAFVSHDDAESLELLGDLAAAGKVVPFIGGRYALEEAPEAIRCVGEGRARGKLVVEVS